ncbi:MAG: type IV pilin protein [Pseudomonadota bacterium]
MPHRHTPHAFISAPRLISRGFTLIELLIVVAIIAIIAAVAYPSYISHVTKTKRVAAEACLGEYANYMERYYSTNMRYDQDSAGTPHALPTLSCASDLSSDYGFSFAPNTLGQSTYRVRAEPRGVQASRDTECGTVSLDQTGTKTESGSGTVSTCW